MTVQKQKLYRFLGLLCLLGYVWFFIELKYVLSGSNPMGFCIWKKATGIPCPSCGSTRALIALFHGDIMKALILNPFSFVVLVLMIVIPIWIGYDWIKKKDTLLRFYIRMEHILSQKKYSIPLILLILVNWFWNIKKGL